MNYLNAQYQLFVAMQLHNWKYGYQKAFDRTNQRHRNHCVAFFWE